MKALSLRYMIGPMTSGDVDEVLKIERASFPYPWPAQAFLSELVLPYSVYWVARLVDPHPSLPLPAAAPSAPSLGFLPVSGGSLTRREREGQGGARRRERGEGGPVVGYAGLQVILDEGHIMTLAVHSDYRRRGISELLLQHLFDQAKRRGVLRLTLEVRASNLPAQVLYRKYGFEVQGRRRRYYANGEDALIMWTGRLDLPENRARLKELRGRLLQRMEEDCDPDSGSGDFL